jgi:DNA-binding NarL/FixJ family response regulator
MQARRPVVLATVVSHRRRAMPRRRISEPDASPPDRVGVVLVDALPVVRAGLSLLIDGEPGLEVLLQTGDADEAIAELAHLRPTRLVVVVGLGLPGPHDGAWLIRTVRERFPHHPVLAMGADSDAAAISRALFVGADGFVDKRVEPDGFLQAIADTADREMVLAGPASSAVGEIAEGIERRRKLDVRLTDREREVLAVAAEGLTAKQIAERLGVRERTVTTHLARIYGKLGVGTRLAAIRVAARSGLVSVTGPD